MRVAAEQAPTTGHVVKEPRGLSPAELSDPPARRSAGGSGPGRLLLVDARAEAEVAPLVQFRALRVCDGPKRAVRVLAENQQRRRGGAFDDGDNRLRCLDRVAGLGAVDGVVLLAALACRLRVVRNRRRRLGE